ncbi:MAG: hypothetical protein FJ290_21795 [Planctomycetes bacterium]|nr:hypothetical protein [Planctomycetota bacterium]
MVLRDGTRINGTILAAGQAAVTIMTYEGEKTIPREKIERVIQNADAGLPRKFAAEKDEAVGHKFLRDMEGAFPPPPKPPEPPRGPDIVPIEAPAPAAKAAEPVEPPAGPPVAPPPAKAVAPIVPPVKAVPAVGPPVKEVAPVAPPAKAVAPVAPPAKVAQPAAPPPKGALPPITFPKTQAELHVLIEKLRADGTLNDYLADPKFRDGFRAAVREAFKNEAPKKEE